MNEQFSKGTICLGQNYQRHVEYNDMECEIIGELQWRGWHCPDTGQQGFSMTYHVLWANGLESVEQPLHLRKKPRPATDTGETRIRELFDKAPIKQPEPELA